MEYMCAKTFSNLTSVLRAPHFSHITRSYVLDLRENMKYTPSVVLSHDLIRELSKKVLKTAV